MAVNHQNTLASSVKKKGKETKRLSSSSRDLFSSIDRSMWNSNGRKPILQTSVTDLHSINLSIGQYILVFHAATPEGSVINKCTTQWAYIRLLTCSSGFLQPVQNRGCAEEVSTTGLFGHFRTLQGNTYVDSRSRILSYHCCPLILKLLFSVMTIHRNKFPTSCVWMTGARLNIP